MHCRWLLSGLIALLPVTVWAQTLTVTSPQTGASLCIGKTYPIRWTRSGDMGDEVSIMLFHKNGQSVKQIIANRVPNNGMFNWPVGIGQPEQYLIQVAVWSSADHPAQVRGRTGLFRIVDCHKPDLRAGSVVLGLDAQHGARLGKTLTAKGRVTNVGDAPAVPSVVRLTVNGPQTLTKTWHMPELAPNQHYDFQYPYTLDKPGRYYNKVEADWGSNFVGESNETNNTSVTQHYTIRAPDLVACINTNYNIRINVREHIPVEVRNVGTAPSPATRVCTRISHRGKKCYDVPPLGPGRSHTVQRSERWISVGSRGYWAEVDPDHRVTEINEGNNHIDGVLHKHTKYLLNPPSQYRCSGH